MGAPFFQQINADQMPEVVGSITSHLPKYAHLDLDLGGRHLTAQIDFDQRVSGDARELLGVRVSGDDQLSLLNVVGEDEVGGDSDDFALSAQLFEIVGRYGMHDENPDAPEATRFQIVGGDEVGGFFNSITRKLGVNKKLERDVKKKTGKDVRVTFHNPTAKQIAKGVAKSVAVAGAVASLAVPGLGIAGAASLAGGSLGLGKLAGSIGGAVNAASQAKAKVHAAGAAVAADKLVAAAERGGKAAKTAAAVVRQTTTLAARGNVDAKAAVKVLTAVAQQRRAANIPRGREQPVTAKGAEALRAFAAAPKLTSVLTPATAPPATQARKGWFISMEPGSYGRIDFSSAGGKWRPA